LQCRLVHPTLQVGRSETVRRYSSLQIYLEDTRAAQDTTIQPGDIVLIRFGWLDWYLGEASPQVRESLRTEQVHPGLEQSHEILAWRWDHRVSLVAANNFAVECWPATPGSPFYTRAEREQGARDPHSGIIGA
jgi:hypothetical protein